MEVVHHCCAINDGYADADGSGGDSGGNGGGGSEQW